MIKSDIREIIMQNKIFGEVIEEIMEIHKKSSEVGSQHRIVSGDFQIDSYVTHFRGANTRFVKIWNFLPDRRPHWYSFGKQSRMKEFFEISETTTRYDMSKPPETHSIRLEKFDLEDTVLLAKAVIVLIVWYGEHEMRLGIKERDVESSNNEIAKKVEEFGRVLKEELVKTVTKAKSEGKEWSFLK